MAMDRPWPWPGPAQKARRLLYKLTTPFTIQAYRLARPGPEGAPFTIQAYHANTIQAYHADTIQAYHANTIQAYRANILGVPHAVF